MTRGLHAPALIRPDQRKDGTTLWLDHSVEEFRRWLHEGLSTCGWSGDPRLELYRCTDGTWEIWRANEDGTHHVCLKSKPGAKLTQAPIIHLASHDMTKGYDPVADILKKNAERYKQIDTKNEENFQQAVERVAHGLKKDLTGKGWHF